MVVRDWWNRNGKMCIRMCDKCLSCIVWSCVVGLVWLLLQVTSFTSFRIPTTSMEPTLLPGDYILVNKWVMGARIFDVMDAAEGKEVETYRLPGWGKIKRNDVVVFNFPHHHRWDSIGMDLMVYYVKRCIGMSGDTVRIKNAQYQVLGVSDSLGYLPAQRKLEKLMASGKAERQGIATGSFPEDSLVDWNIRNFGPLFIPSSGSCVAMDEVNMLLYRRAIEWEQKKKLRMGTNGVMLGDSLITEYKFRRNYYFVGGDNVMYSQDSRYWGLLPEEYIVGKATRIWKSVDLQEDTIRWERVWKKIR